MLSTTIANISIPIIIDVDTESYMGLFLVNSSDNFVCVKSADVMTSIAGCTDFSIGSTSTAKVTTSVVLASSNVTFTVLLA